MLRQRAGAQGAPWAACNARTLVKQTRTTNLRTGRHRRTRATASLQAGLERRRRPTKADSERLGHKSQWHMNAGNISRVARVFASEPLADVKNPAVIAALRSKHPVAVPAEPLAPAEPALQVDGEVLGSVLRRLVCMGIMAGGI